MEVGYDSRGRWSAYGFGQATVQKSGDREDNERYGLGGAFRIGNRLVIDGEVSHGGTGPALKLGTSFQETEETRNPFFGKSMLKCGKIKKSFGGR